MCYLIATKVELTLHQLYRTVSRNRQAAADRSASLSRRVMFLTSKTLLSRDADVSHYFSNLKAVQLTGLSYF